MHMWLYHSIHSWFLCTCEYITLYTLGSYAHVSISLYTLLVLMHMWVYHSIHSWFLCTCEYFTLYTLGSYAHVSISLYTLLVLMHMWVYHSIHSWFLCTCEYITLNTLGSYAHVSMCVQPHAHEERYTDFCHKTVPWASNTVAGLVKSVSPHHRQRHFAERETEFLSKRKKGEQITALRMFGF